MADQVVTIKADNTDFIGKVLQIQEADRATADKMRDNARRSKEGFEGLAKGAEAAAKSIADGLLPGITKIGSAAGAAQFAVTTAFKLIGDAIELNSKRAKEFSDNMEKSIQAFARQGKLAIMPELTKAADEMKSTRTTIDERRSLLHQSLDNSLTGEQSVRGVKFAVRAVDAGQSGEAAAQAMMVLQKAGVKGPELEEAASRLSKQKMTDQEEKHLLSQIGAGVSAKESTKDILGFRESKASARAARAVEGVLGETAEELERPGSLVQTPAQTQRLRELKEKDLATQRRLDAVRERREAAPRAGPGERKEFEAQEKALQRELAASARERTEIDLGKDEDPLEKKQRLTKLALAKLPPEERRKQTLKVLPELVKAEQRKDVASWVREREGWDEKDFVGTGEKEMGELEERSPEFAAAAKVGRGQQQKADIERRKGESVGGAEFEAGMQKGKNVLSEMTWGETIRAALPGGAIEAFRGGGITRAIRVVIDDDKTRRGNEVATGGTPQATD